MTTATTDSLSDNEIINTIIRIIADCIAGDPADIARESRLIPDLGMDSLDFLDIIFGIEKHFGIKLKNTHFEKLLRLELLQEKANTRDALTPAEVEPYREFLPALSQADIDSGISAVDLFSFITVESLLIAVRSAN